MKFRFSLSQKGLILIAVPLMFELALIASLAYLHNEAEVQIARAEHSKSVVDTINQLERDVYDIVSGVSGDRESEQAFFNGQFDSVVNDIAVQLRALQILVQDNPRQSALVQGCFVNGDRAVILLSRAKQLYLKGEFKPKTEGRQETFRQLRKCFRGLLPQEMVSMAGEEKLVARDLPEVQGRYRQEIKALLIAGAGVVVALTVGIFWTYSRQVVSRLNTILDNNIRLASGRALNQQMRGDDEIADLDSAFHSMADSLKEATDKERAIVQNARDVIYSLDERGTFVSVSPASTTVFGYTPEELVGSKLINLAIQDEIVDVLNALKLITEGGNEPPFEMRLKRNDGRIVDIVCSAHWSQKDRTIFCVAHDMTERKQAERLRQEVVQMVSHDLKTPLSTVRSFLEMLDAGVFGDLSDRGQQLLKLADSSTVRMLTLIKDLLDIEKMEAGMLQLERKQVDLQDLLEQSAGSVSAQATEHGVEVEVQPCELKVTADPARIVQVLVNLLSNAIKFSSRGAIVELAADVDGDWVAVRVSDHGRGVPSEKIATIFDRFSQVRASDASEKGGSGLGLAICKALVELHGGQISVESQDGCGSTFVFKLPKSSGVAQAATDQTAEMGNPAVL